MKNFSTQLNEIGDHNNRAFWSTCAAWLVIFMGLFTMNSQAHAAGEADILHCTGTISNKIIFYPSNCTPLKHNESDIGSLQKPGKENTKLLNKHRIETKFIFITNMFLSGTLSQANN
jgi:hypothetical protein